MPEAGIPEVFVDSVRTIETIGPCVRIEFTAGPDSMAPSDRQPAVYLVIPIERIPEAVILLANWHAARLSPPAEKAAVVH
jgi:hypothetical protein